MPDDVIQLTIETQRPRGSFPGRVETGHYVFVEGSVILTDEQGRPIGGDGTKKFIGLDCPNHRNVACMMLRQRRRSIARSRSFNAPIQYGRSQRGV
jgi:hypothetical protein